MTASDAAVIFFIFSVATVSADKLDVNSTTVQHTVLAVHSGNQRVDALLVALAGVNLSLGTPVKTQVERLAVAMGDLESLANEVQERASVMQSQQKFFLTSFVIFHCLLMKLRNITYL